LIMDTLCLSTGLGELTYDHIFVRKQHKLIYLGSRGGGSVFNLLANTVFGGKKAKAFGVGGLDWFGKAAKEELEKIGVDVSEVALLKGRSTRVIFQTIVPDSDNLFSTAKHSFSTSCPVCESKQFGRLASLRQQDAISACDFKNTVFLCFDRLTRDRFDVAKNCFKNGIRTVLDIGRIGYLRYFPTAQIISALRTFDVVLMPGHVAQSFVKRAGFKDIEDICRLAPRLFLFVSEGANGMAVYDTRNKNKPTVQHLSATSNVNVIDDAGAGDAFLGNFLTKLQLFSDQLENCSFSDILSLAESSIRELRPVLSNYGARGHIQLADNFMPPLKETWLNVSIEEIQHDLKNDAPCPFCGNERAIVAPVSARGKFKLGAKSSIAYLQKRMFFAVERKDAINQCKELLKHSGTAYVVGTGGSYPVAVFLSLIFQKFSGIFSQPLRPFDYIRLATKSDFLIVVSYSGSTVDCSEVLLHAKKIGVSNIILLTGVLKPKMQDVLRPQDSLISYGRPAIKGKIPSSERGFVSIAGTITPCTLWASAVVGVEDMVQLASELQLYRHNDLDKLTQVLADSISKKNVIQVMGGGLAWPAMLDLESKFVEGNLGTIQLHEAKDFSHGRFISLLRSGHSNHPVLLLAVGRLHKYEDYLFQTLSRSHPVFTLVSQHTGITGALELLVKVQFLVNMCGSKLGIDISRPSVISPDGIKLYRWSKGLGE